MEAQTLELIPNTSIFSECTESTLKGVEFYITHSCRQTVYEAIAEYSNYLEGRQVIHKTLVNLQNSYAINECLANQVLYNEPNQVNLLTSKGVVSRESAIYRAKTLDDKEKEVRFLIKTLSKTKLFDDRKGVEIALLEYLAAAILSHKSRL